jgi:hypothetical protein
MALHPRNRNAGAEPDVNDQGQEQDNVQQYRREQLEPEIAAMSVETDDDGNPIVIVNIDDPAAKNAIKKVIVWIGALTGLGWIVDWVQRSLRRHVVLAIAGTATVASAVTAVATESARDRPRPPAMAQQVITLPPPPPITVTATPTVKKPTPRKAITPAHTRPPAESVELPRPSAPPAISASNRPRTLPHSTPPPATERPSTSPAVRPTQADNSPLAQPTLTISPDSIPESTPTVTPTQPSPEPEPTPEPEPEPQPPVVADDDCSGLVEVDLDPLLDLCLLG